MIHNVILNEDLPTLDLVPRSRSDPLSSKSNPKKIFIDRTPTGDPYGIVTSLTYRPRGGLSLSSSGGGITLVARVKNRV